MCEKCEELLTAELRGLRKGRGVSAARVAACRTLCSILGTTKHADTLLQEHVMRLGDSIQARALRNAYAFDWDDPKNLTFRRGDFAVQHAKSPDTIEAYENEMIAELAHNLLNTGAEPVQQPEPSAAVQLLRDIYEWFIEESEVMVFNYDVEMEQDAILEAKAKEEAAQLVQRFAPLGVETLELNEAQKELWGVVSQAWQERADRKSQLGRFLGHADIVGRFGETFEDQLNKVLEQSGDGGDERS